MSGAANTILFTIQAVKKRLQGSLGIPSKHVSQSSRIYEATCNETSQDLQVQWWFTNSVDL